MILASIDIANFTSFAPNTRVDFSAELNFVLDPAPSGNCDLLDAIRWATDEIAFPADCEKAEIAVTLADEAGAKIIVRRAAQKQNAGAALDEFFVNETIADVAAVRNLLKAKSFCLLANCNTKEAFDKARSTKATQYIVAINSVAANAKDVFTKEVLAKTPARMIGITRDDNGTMRAIAIDSDFTEP